MKPSIKDLLKYSLDSGASDLHLSVGSIPMVRINGEMKKLQMDPMKMDNLQNIAAEVMNTDQQSVFYDRLEIDFSTSLDGQGRFRVNFFHNIKGIAGVFRTIPDTIKNTEEL